jgi:hypothetical protein
MTIARFAAACLLVAVPLCVLAAADDTLDLGKGVVATFNRHGVLRLTRGGEPIINELFVGTWLGDDFKSQWNAVRIEHSTRNRHVVRRGTIRRDGADQRFELYARAAPPDAAGHRDLVLTLVVDSAEPPPAPADPAKPAEERAAAAKPGDEEEEEADPRTPAWRGKAAVLVRLPIAAYAGQSVQAGRRTARLPKKLGAKPLFLQERGSHELFIGDAASPALYLGRSDPGDVVVQDGRKWGTDAYELQFLLMPTRGERPRRRSIQLLISLGGTRGPIILAHQNDRVVPGSGQPAAVPVYHSVELAVDLWAKFDNPFDAKHIRLTGMFVQPDKTIRTIRGFLYQDFERELEAGRERLTPVGPRDWRVRFTPTQVGEHRYWLLLQTPDGKTQTAAGRFRATPSKHPGFVRVHPTNRRFFARDDGRLFFLVGHNVCWGSSKRLSYDYDDYFRRMQHAGQNYTRVWMCSWDTAIESDRLDSYRLEAAWRLDTILRLAEQRGIVIKLCFDNEHDYQTPNKRRFFGLWKENGGPCTNVLQFFTLPAMQAAYKRRVDYILARWGYSPHIMAWEMWNEMNYIAANNPKSRGVLLDWTREMAAHIKSRDPYGHLVTTSLGLLVVWDELWKMRDIDFAQIHCYLPRPDSARLPEERDAVLAVLKAGERVSGYGKPYHVSEFGYLDLNAVNRTNEKDPTGLHLHNAIWGSLLSGAAGTPSNWWWQRYIHEKNLYNHYASAAGFVDGIDLADAAWQRVVAAGESDVRVLGIKKRDACALWLQRRDNHWYRRIIEGKPPVPLKDVKVRLRDMVGGVYRIIWWDPYSGEITRYRQQTVRRPTDPRKHDLVLKYETALPDVAVKIERVP